MDTVRYLVESGFDASATDRLDWTPLHIAAEGGQLETARYLVEEANADIFAENSEGNTALRIAEFFEHDDVVAYLEAEEDLTRLQKHP